jgi:hypothetical protein
MELRKILATMEEGLMIGESLGISSGRWFSQKVVRAGQ